MANVRYLCLRHADIGDAGAWHVAYCPNLANLKFLDLSCCQIDDPGVRALCRSPYLKKLEHLQFERNRFGTALEPLSITKAASKTLPSGGELRRSRGLTRQKVNSFRASVTNCALP